MKQFFAELHRRNPVLSTTGWIHFSLLAVLAVLSLFDSRQILGINAWFKPMKFMVSIAIYCWTVGWLLHYVREARRGWAVVTWGTAAAMLAETACLILQSARGTTSHYNIGTPFDGVVFMTMGIMIGISTMLTVLLLWLFFTTRTDLPPSYLLGIRIGIVLFLFGSWVGGRMIGQMAHTVGGPDGGPGLPFLSWSTDHGDLRIAHAVGLHALQILPLAGFVLRRRRHSVFATTTISILYGGTAILLYLVALNGTPLL